MEEQVKKAGRGRPRKQEPTVSFNLRLELDLHEWVKANKGKKSINQFINDIIRKEANL